MKRSVNTLQIEKGNTMIESSTLTERTQEKFVESAKSQTNVNEGSVNPDGLHQVLVENTTKKSVSTAETTFTSKTFLHVSFAEKDLAKAAGAQWDKAEKKWFAPAGIRKEPLRHWLAPATEGTQQREPRMEFGEALEKAGLVLPGVPVMNGVLQRVPVVEGKPGALDGAYVGHLDTGRPAGYIQNFRTGERTNWKSGADYNPDQKASLALEASANLAQRAEDLAQRQEKAAEIAQRKWDQLKEPVEQFFAPYLTRKQVGAYGIRRDGDKVVISIRDIDGKLWSLQTISSQSYGNKSMEKDGRKMGNMHIIGDLAPGKEILVVEGYATGASIHQATGLTVVVAFDSGNLNPVVKTIKERFPTNPIYVAGDNDVIREVVQVNQRRFLNLGAEKALGAAFTNRVGIILPYFDRRTQESDFNDLHIQKGLQAVKKQIEEGLKMSPWESQQKARRLLVEQSRAFIAQTIQGVKSQHEVSPATQQRHSGVVLAVTPYHLVQDIGDAKAVVHNSRHLVQTVESGKYVTIEYRNQQVIMTEKKTDRSRTGERSLSR
jgi:phage/plasmid primase-like uncharacterized protein